MIERTDTTELETNPELELAYEYLEQTRRHLFLTGKAGTGKTTFLHRVRRELKKRMVVVAPTGVAAINAKGVTIHSFFQLPFGVLTPERLRQEIPRRRYSTQKIDLYRSLQLLVIDEISMVRADVLDAIDAVLRRYRQRNEPFGGLQLLMIGDLHQLPPVIRPEDWRAMEPYYQTGYFFGSIALRKAAPTTVQLRKIYRQRDDAFIKLLNRVRSNQLDAASLQQLNDRYVANYRPPAGEHQITLTSHNRAADRINGERLDALPAEARTFYAEIKGTFPASLYPNQPELTFKVGAQVMFNKNDTTERLYFNGKIGTIEQIEGEEIKVRCANDELLTVIPVSWENRKYEPPSGGGGVVEKVIGSYSQHPLRLAWGITIHKSQGLTFERVIIDAEAAFAHGQVYVALSRCTSLEGIVLSSPIRDHSVRTDGVVSDYSRRAEDNPPTQDDLWRDKYEYQAFVLRDLFGFAGTERAAARLKRLFLEEERSIQSGPKVFAELYEQIEKMVIDPANRFGPALHTYLRQPALPVENAELSQRLAGAARYFVSQIKETALPKLATFGVLSDNSLVSGKIEALLNELKLELYVKLRLFEKLSEGFDPVAFPRYASDARRDFQQGQMKIAKRRQIIPPEANHPKLYRRLSEWREETATTLGRKPYRVISNETLLAIVNLLPTTEHGLLAMPRFGRQRYADHGTAILTIITDFARDKDLPTDLFVQKSTEGKDDKPGRVKMNTRYESLCRFEDGETPEQIATARNLKIGTVYGHLTYWVRAKKLTAEQLLPAVELLILTEAIERKPGRSDNELFNDLNRRYPFWKLRLARAVVAKN